MVGVRLPCGRRRLWVDIIKNKTIMPNWCYNRLEVTGDKKEVKKFREQASRSIKDEQNGGEVAGELAFDNFVPTPPEMLKGQEWYNWRIENWGTKWDAGEVELEDEWENEAEASVLYRFDTAWAPPVKWLDKVARQYPKLYFKLKYEEEGMGFMGVARGQGEITDTYLEY